MLETELKKLTTAITELTARIQSGTTVPVKSGPSQEPAASAPAAAEVTETAPAPVADPAPVAEVPTKKALVEKFIELASAKGRETATKLLADYGVVKLPELTDKTKWADFYAACEGLLNK